MFLLINRPVLCMLIQLSRCYDDHSTHHSTGQVHFAKNSGDSNRRLTIQPALKPFPVDENPAADAERGKT